MAEPFEVRPESAKLSLIELIRLIVGAAGEYGQAELRLIRADIANLAHRAAVLAALSAVALVIGLVALFILAQASVAALGAIIGLAFAGFVIGAVLLIAVLIIALTIRSRVRKPSQPHSPLLAELFEKRTQRDGPALSNRDLAIVARSQRDVMLQSVEAAKEKLRPANLSNELIEAVDHWTATQAYISRHPFIVGIITAAAAWLLPAKMVTKAPTPKPRKRTTTRTNQKMENRHGNQRTHERERYSD